MVKHLDDVADMTDDELIMVSETLKDELTPNGKNWEMLQELLEIERELTLREGK